MGLAICRSIVEAHGGRLWLAPDQSAAGTAICFALPLATKRLVRRPDVAKNRR
jgi:two-component system sensor histidine kinase KdpD